MTHVIYGVLKVQIKRFVGGVILVKYIHTYIHTCIHTYLPTYLPTYIRGVSKGSWAESFI